MKYRQLGTTGFKVSEVSLGTWQLGGKWGTDFDSKKAEETLNTAIDKGVNFIDTADVYRDGKSENAVAKVVKSRREQIYVATKCGSKLEPKIAEAFTPQVLRKFVEDSLANTGFDTLDLIQLHCPPTQVYYRPEIFEMFDKLKDQGKIQNLGVSVEKVEEGLKAIEYPNVTTVQIIYNMFRQRPAEFFFEQANKKDVGIIVRVPLASGLLTGKFSKNTQFGKQDHRNFNRDGKSFDKGETFAGVDYETGLHAVDELKKVFPEHNNLAPVAIKWILMNKNVSCVIPGASKIEHVKSNISASELPSIPDEKMEQVEEIYEKYIKASVHQRW
ncbi:MAG: aldo/keto reductase [Candidatus Marinimicrobia bacterium]|nr:aldo/keto reductase [Candidatus Neomarinimicrobiota bacterium]